MGDVKLNGLASDWRGALDAADETLDALGRGRRELHFSPTELRERSSALTHERYETDEGLELLARATNTHLHHHMTGRRKEEP